MKYKILAILFIAIMVLFCSGITYSVFSSNATIRTTDQKIAKFVFNYEKVDHLELPLLSLKPGDSEQYLFSITNDFSGKRSDVTINYQITIKTMHLMPLEIKLYKLGTNDELVITCDETITRNDKGEIVCNSKVFDMAYDKEILDNYKLQVSFENEYNTEAYVDLVDYIDVDIKSYQKL